MRADLLEQHSENCSSVPIQRAEANNAYLEDYQPDKPTSYIIYQDANNLYGHAMIQHLPVSEF